MNEKPKTSSSFLSSTLHSELPAHLSGFRADAAADTLYAGCRNYLRLNGKTGKTHFGTLIHLITRRRQACRADRYDDVWLRKVAKRRN